MPKCQFPDGIVIKPDGVNELDPCMYVRKKIHKNVTVFIEQCSICGHVHIAWKTQENTESTIFEELVENKDSGCIIKRVIKIEEEEND